MLLERSPAWHWRAGGVFTSPAAVAALRRVGLDEATLAAVARPIPAMRVETPDRDDLPADLRRRSWRRAGRRVRSIAARPGPPERAAAAGADVRRGLARRPPWTLAGARSRRARPGRSATCRRCERTVIVGADGPHSVVARAAGVAAAGQARPRVGLTYHLADPDPTGRRDARMRVLRDGYVGIAPVPGRTGQCRDRARPVVAVDARRDGARAVADAIVAAIPPTEDDPDRGAPATRPTRSRAPRRSATASRAGPARAGCSSGDAAGFLDPFTGEGLHRALVSAELAAAAIAAHDRRAAGGLEATTARCSVGSLRKDAVSWLVQAFLARPALFDYAARRVAARPCRSCDDGSRDGRPRPGVPRARSALPRRAARAMTDDDDRVRVAAYCVCLDDAGRILLCRVSPSDRARAGTWTLPGGGLDFGEAPEAASSASWPRRPGYEGEVDRPDRRVDRRLARHRREGGRVHAIRIVYRVRITGGELRDEVDGSTDTCAWFTPDEAARLHLGDLARRVLAMRDRGRLTMHSTIAIDVAAPPELVFALARDVERWDAAAPPLRALAGDRAPRRMARSWSTSSRAGRCVDVLGLALPVAWRSRTWDEPATRRLRFVHVAGATKGMDVTWRIEPPATARRRHDRPRLPARGVAGLRGLRRSVLHPADRRPDARHVQGARRGRRGGGSPPTASPRRPSRRIHRMSDRRRIWITGLGIITAIGTGARRSGPASAPATPRSSASTGSTRAPFRSQVAAQVDDFDPLAWMPPKTARQLDRFSQFGLVAGRLALDDARLTPGDRRWRPSASGSGSTSARRSAASPMPRSSTSATSRAASARSRRTSRWRSSAARRRPTSGIALDVRGPILSTANSCASGAVALGEALGDLREGRVDAAIAGGVEIPLSPLAFGAFDIIRALSAGHNDDPGRPSGRSMSAATGS